MRGKNTNINLNESEREGEKKKQNNRTIKKGIEIDRLIERERERLNSSNEISKIV